MSIEQVTPLQQHLRRPHVQTPPPHAYRQQDSGSDSISEEFEEYALTQRHWTSLRSLTLSVIFTMSPTVPRWSSELRAGRHRVCDLRGTSDTASSLESGRERTALGTAHDVMLKESDLTILVGIAAVLSWLTMSTTLSVGDLRDRSWTLS